MTPEIKSSIRFGAVLMLAAFLLCAPQAQSQTVLSSTTLAAALSNNTSTVSLASATGVTAPGPNGTNLTVLVVEREVMLVQTISGTVSTVARGQYGTDRVAHVSGATVWVAPDKAIARGAIPSGSCTRTNLPYVPIVYVAPTVINGGVTGATFDCMGGQIVRTNAPSTYKGSDVSSATSITPTGTFFVMSGTVNPVTTIVVPAGWSAGNCLNIEPTGIWTTTTAGNIQLGTTAVVGKILTECWDGSKWNPSY